MVEIAYHLQRHPNSFLLHSVVVPGAAAKDANSELSDWFTTRKKQVFIDSGIKVMFVGSPMLAQLVVSGSVEEVREVLEKSDPEWKAVDSVDSYGQTLLHSATAQRRPDLVQLLLEFDPDVEDQNRSGSSLLKAAAGGGEALRVSTERSETLKWGSVHEAASDHTEILRLLILKELMWARRQKTEPRPRR